MIYSDIVCADSGFLVSVILNMKTEERPEKSNAASTMLLAAFSALHCVELNRAYTLLWTGILWAIVCVCVCFGRS